VTNIRVEGFAAGDDQENRSQHHEGACTIDHEEFEPVYRIDRSKHFGGANDLLKAEQTDRCKPQQCDRAEHRADAGSAMFLEEEKCNENRNGNRQHVGFEKRCSDVQALDSADDRDRRSDHPVGIK
jgi:hypothetical protein